jgi:hypothetical protein
MAGVLERDVQNRADHKTHVLPIRVQTTRPFVFAARKPGQPQYRMTITVSESSSHDVWLDL